VHSHPGLAEPRTKEEWRAYLDDVPPERPVLPSYEEYLALGDRERTRLNLLRRDYHSALVIVRTERMKQLHHVIARRMAVNARQAAGARRGVVIDGPPTLGKSTLVKTFGFDHEHQLRLAYPERFQRRRVVDGYLTDYIPVIYISIPSQATPKDLSALVADYLGHPYRVTATKNEITRRVLESVRLCGTELIIVDDAHFLDLSAKEGRVANDHLKYLANHCAATFVYTGHELEKSGLFLEGLGAERATQTSGRNSLHRLERFQLDTETQKREWAGVIKTMEDSLALLRHRPGTLTRYYRYLYDRADGSICGLADLIRESAVEAVMTGQEAITKRLMDTIVISKHAEAAYQRRLKRQAISAGQARRSPTEREPA
jgi:Bacterial TniB protein